MICPKIVKLCYGNAKSEQHYAMLTMPKIILLDSSKIS